DVRLHRHVRPERVVLEHHADVTRVRPEPVDAPVPEPDLAAVRRMEAGDQPEKRRLAAARGPEQREQLAVADLEAHAVDRGHAPELLTHLAEPDLHRRSRSSTTTPGSGRHGRYGFLQVDSMSVRNFCLSASDRFCATSSS